MARYRIDFTRGTDDFEHVVLRGPDGECPPLMDGSPANLAAIAQMHMGGDRVGPQTLEFAEPVTVIMGHDCVRITEVVCDYTKGPGATAMERDGWSFDPEADVWTRRGHATISGERHRSGRYAQRLPTNRDRIRQRCKARRRSRFNEG